MSKKESKEKRVDDILEAAVNVFAEKGYENASMNDIATRAGMSKGGLYHHFLSKDIVLLYANQKLLEPCKELMRQVQNNKSAKDGLSEYVREYVKYWMERKKELIFFSLSMTKAMTHHDIFKMYESFIENYIVSLEELFKKGFETGEFKQHDFRGSAVALISALDGVLVYMALDKKLKPEDIVKYYIDIFILPVIK